MARWGVVAALVVSILLPVSLEAIEEMIDDFVVNWATWPNNGRKIAVDESGDVHAVWQKSFTYRQWLPYWPFYIPSSGQIGYRVRYGGGWSGTSYSGGYYPSIAINPVTGVPYMICVQGGTPELTAEEVMVYKWGPGGWQLEHRADTVLMFDEYLRYPSIAFDANGKWHAAWTLHDFSVDYARAMVKYCNADYEMWKADTVDWNRDRREDAITNVSIDIDLTGRPVVAYQEWYGWELPMDYVVESAYRVGYGEWNWTSPGDGYFEVNPCIDFNKFDNQMHAIWEKNEGEDPYTGDIWHNFGPGDEWQWFGPFMVNCNNTPTLYPVVDDGHAVWMEALGPGASVLWYAKYLGGSPWWGDHEPITCPSWNSIYPQVAFVGDPGVLLGYLHVMWTREEAFGSSVWYQKKLVQAMNPQTARNGRSSVPRDLSLLGVPNPFTDEVHVQLELPHDSEVQLHVHDASGRVVKSLANGQFPAGAHRFLWTGEDDTGTPVPSGVYVCKAVCGDHSTSTKMILAR